MFHHRAWVVIAFLLFLGCGNGASGPEAGPEGIDLPRVGTLGRTPGGSGTIRLDVDADGRIRLGEKGPLSLLGLREELQRLTRDPRWREPDRASLKILLVNADAALPWTVAQWIMQVAAEPTTGIYRIFFGARDRQTTAVGAIGCTLPKDRGGPIDWDVYPPPRLRVRVGSHDGPPSAPEDLLAPLRAAAGKGPVSRVDVEICHLIRDGRLAPTGFVVQVLDVALRAGVHKLSFEGAPLPWDFDPGSVEDLLARVAEVKAKMGQPYLAARAGEVGSSSAPEPVPESRGRLLHLYGSGVERREPRPRGEARLDEDDEESEEVQLPFEGPLNYYPLPTGNAFSGRNRPAEGRAEPVERALEWLAAHQSSNGGWEAAGFGRWCGGKPVDPRDQPSGAGQARRDVAVTGLALSAFLGAGYTNRGRHAYAKTVSRGLRYLKNVQDAEGCFGSRDHDRWMLDHAIAALAMVEAYGMTRSPIYKGSAQKSLDFLAQIRDRRSVWTALPWVSARMINEDAARREKPLPLRIDPVAIDTGTLDEDEWGISEHPVTATAAATFLAALLGRDPELPAVLSVPNPESEDALYWCFGCLATYQFGGDAWDAWSKARSRAVIGRQRTDTDSCRYLGSWDPEGPWCEEVGRVAATAISALALVAEYRYPRAPAVR